MSRSITPTPSLITSSLTSPAGEQHGDNLQLTPKSKFKTMMAAVDEDSDSEASIQPKESRFRTVSTIAAVQSQGRPGSPGSTYSSSGDDARQLLAPRGKLASRLTARNSPKSVSSRSDNNDAGDAYARLKRKLGRPSNNSPAKGRSLDPPRTSLSTDEDEILPAVTRRKRRTFPNAASRSHSPQASPETLPRSSPGLFLTPRKEPKSHPQSPFMGPEKRKSSDSVSPADSQAHTRVLALVARKREEREAKAEAEAEKKAKRLAQLRAEEQDRKKGHADSLGASEDDSDVAGGEKFTQHARPTRKASKKALEEMNRETQRMNRNMQLAHQARTKKKITKESFFARFNFRNANASQPSRTPATSSSAIASSNPASDAEIRCEAESPPTSPVTPSGDSMKAIQYDQDQTTPLDACKGENCAVIEEELPDTQTIIAQSQEHRKIAPALALEINGEYDLPDLQQNPGKGKVTSRKHFQVRLPKTIHRQKSGEDSESDLEVVPAKKLKRKLDVFDRLLASKVSEGRSLQTLRALANLTSNEHTTGTKSYMSVTDMQNSLQRRARQQAARERTEKIQELKDRGAIIQTAEERQKDQAEVEDLLEKARREATDLKQKEKDVAKKQAKANGEAPIADSSDEDEDYQYNNADESGVDLSGSEDEGEGKTLPEAGDEVDEELGDDQEGDEDDASVLDGGLIENAASEASDDEDEEGEVSHEEDEMFENEHVKRIGVRRGRNMVIDDEEDEEMQEEPNGKRALPRADSQPLLNLGLPPFAGAPMGMTQAFAATMADSQTQDSDQGGIATQEEDSLAFLGAPPEPELPVFDMNDSPQIILDSQEASNLKGKAQAEILFEFSQSQTRGPDTDDTITGTPATQLSEIPDPTQDVGFLLTSPVAGRYSSVPPSTVDTIILPQPNQASSPAVRRRGRLMRKANPLVDGEFDVPMGADDAGNDTIISANAFDVLKKGSKKQSKEMTTFDKKKSNAHEMVEEQAQESEDEYAGLGGASDDESGGEEDEEVRKMIEQGEVDVDERQLAAFYANKERASDEKAVEKLFKNINNGMLRRKRGAEFDLSDSEDDAEARRRRNRKEFAKMRKALLENENVGKIAEDPKKLAFLRAIEDREDDEDLDFLDQPEESSQPAVGIESQEIPDTQPQALRETSTTAIGKRKRPLTESNTDAANRPPAAARRTPATSKPQSLAEIRASVSFLIEEPDAMPIAVFSSSPPASDNEDENDENIMNPPQAPTTSNNNNNPFYSRRRTTAPIIDRLSLKRTSTSTSSTSTSNLFFHGPTTDSSSFKVPSLLRRATTSSSSTFNTHTKQDSHGISHLAETERAAGGGEKGDFIRKGGGKKSSVNWVRKERRTTGDEGQKMGKMLRREGSSLVGLGGGMFE